MSALSTLAALSGSERAALLRASITVAAVRAALWLLPSRAIVRYVGRLAARTTERSTHTAPLPQLVWAIEAAARRIPGASCLTQAIAGLLLFRRHGYAARFCVGVAHGENGELKAHAWLERDGETVIGGGQPGRFVVLPDLAEAVK